MPSAVTNLSIAVVYRSPYLPRLLLATLVILVSDHNLVKFATPRTPFSGEEEVASLEAVGPER